MCLRTRTSSLQGSNIRNNAATTRVVVRLLIVGSSPLGRR
ncbi:unnamed protein product [Brassica oleracea]